MTTEIDGIKIIFGDPRQPKALALNDKRARWAGFKSESVILPKGYIKRRGALALPCDIRFDRDVPVKLRDSTTIYVDIFRPTDSKTQSPALLAWSPYGKNGGGGNQTLDDFPFRAGVPLSELSELQKWEGPDPAYWVQYGYTVINADPRGAGKSEGDIRTWGSQEGRDEADVIDWIGQQEWCSGKVGLTGNSWLAVSQWFAAAENPKHLTCIAPWEGFSDVYREALCVGGVLSKPDMNFGFQMTTSLPGEQSWENMLEMAVKHKNFNKYHEDKRAKIENIDIPAYIVAAWSNTFHAYGTLRAFQRLKSDKWLRVHDSMEWPDYYQEESRTDLHKFFDYYLKDIQNSWPSTPRVRMKIIDTANVYPLTGTLLTASAFPLPEVKPLKLYLSGTKSSSAGILLQQYPPTSSLSYSNRNGEITCTYTFSGQVILCGPITIMLSVALTDTLDADLFIYIDKILQNGIVGSQLQLPFQSTWQSWLIQFARKLRSDADLVFYSGPSGRIRVSRRLADEKLSLPGFPIQCMDVSTPIAEGEIVQVVPPIVPIGMHFASGEKLRVRIGAVNQKQLPAFPGAELELEGVPEVNGHGKVQVHCGLPDNLGSYILLPVIPQN